MRISASNTGIGVTTALRQLTDLLAAPAPALPDRYPDKPRRDLPDTVRVVEGELLRPAPAPDTLLNLYQASAISAQARRVDTPAPPSEPSRTRLPGIRVYQMHSSNENPGAYAVGDTLNQYA
jgi:hypothetical protein